MRGGASVSREGRCVCSGGERVGGSEGAGPGRAGRKAPAQRPDVITDAAEGGRGRGSGGRGRAPGGPSPRECDRSTPDP